MDRTFFSACVTLMTSSILPKWNTSQIFTVNCGERKMRCFSERTKVRSEIPVTAYYFTYAVLHLQHNKIDFLLYLIDFDNLVCLSPMRFQNVPQ